MRISRSWLCEWVHPTIDEREVVRCIVQSGLVVENIRQTSCGFRGVKIGQIVQCRQLTHDRCFVQVNIGHDRVLNVVSGNVSCRANSKVAVAPSGDKIRPTDANSKEFLPSEGKLCTYFDLCLSQQDRRVVTFPSRAPIGASVEKYLRFDDCVMDVKFFPNQSHYRSLLGIARNVDAVNLIPSDSFLTRTALPTTHDSIAIENRIPHLCPRYLGRILRNADFNADTPVWMKEKLRRCGRCGTNVVDDVLNYVRWELGYPVNILGLRNVHDKIVVRLSRIGERMRLSDRTIDLVPNTPVVCVRKTIVSIAGLSSRMHTPRSSAPFFLLESAFFHPSTVLDYARRYRLRSRVPPTAINFELQRRSLHRLSRMTSIACGGELGPVSEDSDSKEFPQRKTIVVTQSALHDVVGCNPQTNIVNRVLSILGYKVEFARDAWTVRFPQWMHLVLPEDIIEEIVRIYGYDKLDDSTVRERRPIDWDSSCSLNRVKWLLADRGYHEVVTYSFVDSNLQSFLHRDDSVLPLLNPISKEMSVMRVSLLTGLIRAALRNQRRQHDRIVLFESGFKFIRDPLHSLGVRQDFVVSGLINGNQADKQWNAPTRSMDFFDVKGHVESILDTMNHRNRAVFRKSARFFLHPQQSADVRLDGEKIGFFGRLHPRVEQQCGLLSPTMVFELLWSRLARRSTSTQIENPSRFPMNRRDVSVLVSEDVTAQEIVRTCTRAGSRFLRDVRILDVYRGGDIANNRKSVTVRLFLQSAEHTLCEKEIRAFLRKCTTLLQSRCNAVVR